MWNYIVRLEITIAICCLETFNEIVLPSHLTPMEVVIKLDTEWFNTHHTSERIEVLFINE